MLSKGKHWLGRISFRIQGKLLASDHVTGEPPKCANSVIRLALGPDYLTNSVPIHQEFCDDVDNCR